jgi:peptidoglycan hydrolase-like protein with peptidoglycan-binding domain
MLTTIAMIALGALGIALLLTALLQSRRRRPSSTPTTHQQSDAPQPGADHEITAARTSPAPDGEHSNGTPPRPPDPARVEQVKALQRRLDALGFDPGPLDGHYGPRTTAAVKHLQHHNGFKADGIVGRLTARLLAHNTPQPPTNDRAQRVKTLQHQLTWLGYQPGRADGHYGPQTTQAVKQFQQTHHLPADGIVDHPTASTLKATITQRPSAHRTDRVKTLQHQLQTLGLNPGPIDGRYGPQTTQAVKRFQQTHHLPTNGIIDPHTHHALQHTLQKTPQT